MISTRQLELAVSELSEVGGVYFDPAFLVEDVAGVARSFPEPGDFEAAIASTVRMLGLIVEGKVDVSRLEDDYQGWSCCHYQHRIAQGTRATMRLMFTRDGENVRVRGFGDRKMPADFYHRMAEIGRMGLGEEKCEETS